MPHNRIPTSSQQHTHEVSEEEITLKNLAKEVYVHFTLVIDYISYGINYLISLMLKNFFGNPEPSLVHNATPTFHPAVLITGASVGVGRDVAITLARKGYTVFAAVNKSSDFDSLLQQFRDHNKNENNGTLRCIVLDMTDRKAMQKTYHTIRHDIRNMPFAGLINAATTIIYLPLEVASDLAIRDCFETNLFGVIHLTKLFLPLLKESRGRVINVGSISSLCSTSSMAIYAASKAALKALTRTWRQEVRSLGINMMLIEPGIIDTQYTQKVHRDFQEFKGFSISSPYHEENVNPKTLETYEEQFTIVGKLFDEVVDAANPPGIVTDAIIHALTSRFPKTTYYVGMDSKFLAFMNWVLGEHISEAIQEKIFGF
ncbi:11301_t:CDS:2 [Ambispora gerdemannii]|uniref:11301_t:CDS:1 n=1 Tax=Ambispora gerdemannii TaxID=144530 RepID=A0A9N9FK80_9GLOM|nr:11301_t:CDS:2 [Ambispora gerdemannii]